MKTVTSCLTEKAETLLIVDDPHKAFHASSSNANSVRMKAKKGPGHQLFVHEVPFMFS